MIIGLLVIALIAVVALIAYLFTKDKFDYADENAKELSSNLAGWNSETWTSDINLNIDQASVVLYWHDKDTLRWKCDGDDPEKQSDSSLRIHQSHCLLFLPKATTNLDIEQSQVVLVKPQVSITVKTNQTSIRVAENGEKYKYAINMKRSKVVGLLSQDDAKYTLQFETNESSIASYEY